MGWWNQNVDGVGVTVGGDGSLMWGDAPADLIDDAIVEAILAFRDGVGRYPTAAEVWAGLLFSAGDLDDTLRDVVEAYGEVNT